MGYPMTYPRVVRRNGLTGNYAGTGFHDQSQLRLIAGDMRRLELDQQDDRHLAQYAEFAGVTKEQAAAVLRAFFTDFGYAAESPWLAARCW